MDNMRVLCLNPAPLESGKNKNDLLVKEGRCMERSGAWSNLRMPLTLAYISSILKKAGHEVKLIDNIANYQLRTPVNIHDFVDSFQPDIAILNTSMPSIFTEDMPNARIIKEKNEKTFIAVFGVAPTLIAEEILNSGVVDVCIRNEPEGIIKELCEKSTSNEWKKINGISFKNDGKIIHNSNSEIVDLDSLPYPDYESLPLEAYKTPVDRRVQILLEVSRGCPHLCTYCTGSRLYGHKFRHRKPVNVLNEIEHVVKLGVTSILFWADTFTLNRSFIMEICNGIIERGLNKKIKWVCNSRVDRVDPELLKKMDESGCFLIGFGVESGVQKILDYVKKGIKLEDTRNAFKWIKETNMSAASHVIFGLAPFENEKTIRQTIKFIDEIKPNYVNFHIVIPYPGTEIYEIYNEKGYIISKNFSELESNTATISLPELSNKDLEKWRDYAFYRFYLKPRTIIQEIKNLKSVGQFSNLIDNSLWFFQGWVNVKVGKR